MTDKSKQSSEAKLCFKSMGQAYDSAPLLKALKSTDNSMLRASNMDNIVQSIEKQRRAIDALSKPLTSNALSEPLMRSQALNLRSPFSETNQTLARIEDQFEQFSIIAKDSALVATDLQAYAAEFLRKFEQAAEDTRKSGRNAIIVAFVALLIGVSQILAPMFIQDQDAESLRLTIVDLNSEVWALRVQQTEENKRLVEALETSNQTTAEVVRNAMNLLKEKLPTLPVVKE